MTSRQKILGALAVIAVCAVLQIVFWPREGQGPAAPAPHPVAAAPKKEPEKNEETGPGKRDPTQPAAQAPGQARAEPAQKLGDDAEEADPGSIPVPDDLPQEADGRELGAACAAWLTEQGLGSARDLKIVSRGEVAGAGVGAAPLSYWVYAGVRAGGQKAQFTVTYDPSTGFDIGSY